VLGLLASASEADIDEVEETFRELPADLQYHVCANLSVLALLEPVPGMPDPRDYRQTVAQLLGRLDRGEPRS
jgi:hypothetical protein